MTNRNPNENPQKKYMCDICHYITCNKKDYNKHLLTSKHNRLIMANNQTNKKSQEHFECGCGNSYKHLTSLYKHKKKCNFEEKKKEEIKNELENELSIITNKDDLIIKLIKDNEEFKQLLKEQNSIISQQQQHNFELVQTIKDITPKIGNHTNITNNTTNNTTHNTFNLQLFLNETCKDAKRPVHCTDAKRETLYIKDQEKWEKDENHQKIMEAFENIAEKQRDYLWEWSEANPESMNVHHPLNDVFHHTNVKVLDPLTKKEQEGKKFIRNITKEIVIDKK